MKCKNRQREFEYRVYNPNNIYDLYNFIPHDIIKHHKTQMMVPTEGGLKNVNYGDFIVKEGDFYKIYTENEFNEQYVR